MIEDDIKDDDDMRTPPPCRVVGARADSNASSQRATPP